MPLFRRHQGCLAPFFARQQDCIGPFTASICKFLKQLESWSRDLRFKDCVTATKGSRPGKKNQLLDTNCFCVVLLNKVFVCYKWILLVANGDFIV